MQVGSCFGLVSLAALAVTSVAPAAAQEAGDGFVRVSAGRTKLVDKGTVQMDGVAIPGADYTTRETYHTTLSGGYYVTDGVAVEASISSPVTTDNTPAGTISMYSNLADDELLITTLGASFHPFKGPVSPYVGAGAQWQIITRVRDRLASGFHAKNSIGPYVSAGLDIALNNRLGVFVEGRKAFYDTIATGNLAGYAVRAKAKLDPVSINVGMTAKFGPSTNREDAQAITTDTSRWVVRLGYSSINLANKVDLNVGGAPLPGTSLLTYEHQTPTLQVGYFLTKHFAVNATVGIPPTIDVFGGDSIGTRPEITAGPVPMPKLGRITYGPTALTVQYHPTRDGVFRPYVGAGISYMFVFSEQDGALKDLNVKEDLGYALEAGSEFMVTNKTALFIEAKKAFLRPKISGVYATMPADGKATLDPWVFSGGVAFHF